MIKPLDVPVDLAEQTYRSLRDAICDGVLVPGERLVQEELAERLGVSRQPVLQALRRLENEGLTVAVGRRGLIVAPLDPSDLAQLYAVRGAIDALAASEAARRATTQDVAQGRVLVEAGRQAARRGSAQSMIAADMALHQYIYALSGNPWIAGTLETHWHHIRRSIGVILRSGLPWVEIWDEHESIVDAIGHGNAHAAARLSLHHTDEAASILHRYIRPENDEGGS